jgi:3-isopropylmalate/(R)-2-methylmalate dehydratase small subunit
VAPSFGDIFHNNSFQNGLLPVMLPAERVAALRALLEQSPGSHIAIDLEKQTAPTGRRNRQV